MDMTKSNIEKLVWMFLAGLYSVGATSSAFAAAPNISQDPLALVTSADPNILINLSVEVPMGGAAYNDQSDGGSCGGRVNDGGTVGVCYFKNTEYVGYFNPNRCYNYTGGYFRPKGATNSDHECSGRFSGNFMNWATMTAMDAFLYTMTGGNRVTDTTALTVIERAMKYNNNGWFPYKMVRSTQNVAPSTVTPWSSTKIYIKNNDWTVDFGTSRGGSDKGTYNVRVKVCKVGKLEANCVEYDNAGTPYYKPEGLIQRNAANKRFAVTSYLKDSTIAKNGGVLRSKMKYVGPDMPQTSGFGARINNTAKEFGTDGLYVTDPDGQASATPLITDSGVLNYLNKFSRKHGYKGYDPVSELFYESLHYFRGQTIANKGPTTEYLPSNSNEYGEFPAYATWDDPIQYECQKNFIVGLNDAFPHRDKAVPGTYWSASDPWGDGDFGNPSAADTFFDAKAWTNKLGNDMSAAEQLLVWSPYLSSAGHGAGGLGEIRAWGTGTATPDSNGRKNTYYVAGLAYQANTTDIRSESNMPGAQTVSTFMMDTQEYNSNPLTGVKNPLWLTGKYGGFIDSDADGTPNLASEWDADGDGEPDNYVLVTDPSKMITALNKAFADIDKRSSSSSAVVANSVRLQAGTKIFQARFHSGEWSGELLAFPVNADGSVGSVEWNAQTLIDAQAWNSGRNIFSFDPTASSNDGEGIPFTWSDLNATQQASLNINPDSSPSASDAQGENRLEFLRGNQAKEADKSGGIFRIRSSVFGDLINSAPAYVAAPNFLYDDAASCGGTPSTCYSAYKATHVNRMPIIYAGGNDGMLHGIIPEESSASAGDEGTEVVAYIPNFLIDNLNELTSQNYAHRFFVDGNPTVSDVFIDMDGTGPGSDAWYTVLIGGARAGGQGYFALNISDPTDVATVESAAQSSANAKRFAI